MLPSYYFNDVASAVPVLIINGGLSPSGSTDWPAMIQHSLPNANLISFATLGEGVLDSPPPCLDSLRREFLSDPSIALKTSACASQSPSIQFTANP